MALIAMLGVLLGRTGAGHRDPLARRHRPAGGRPLALRARWDSRCRRSRPARCCCGPGRSRRAWRGGCRAALALALSVPLAAQLACGPLLVVITPTVPAVRRRRESACGAGGPARDGRRARRMPGGTRCPGCSRDSRRSPGCRPRGSPAPRTTVSSLPGDQVPWLRGVGRGRGAGRGEPGDRRGDRLGRPRRGLRAAAALLLAVVAGVVAGGGGARLGRGRRRRSRGVERARVRRRAGGCGAGALRGGRRAHRHRPGPAPCSGAVSPERAWTASTCSC